MTNMAYCQFQNTKQDMEQCLDTLMNQNVASEAEGKAAKSMFTDVLVYLLNEGIIEDFDEAALASHIDASRKGNESDEPY